jgi:ribose transport system permease protein
MKDTEKNDTKAMGKKWYTTQTALLVFLISAMSVVATIFNPAFFTINNLLNVLNQNAVIGIVAAGATLVMISGNFDISVGNMIGLSTTTSALLIVRGWNVAPSVIMGFLICAACGLANGIIIAKTRTPSFIITLAMMSVYRGISLITTGGITQSLSGKFSVLGRGFTFGVIPNPILVCFGIYIIIWLILKYTKFGRRVYAVGGNENAAYLSGVNTDRTKIAVYLLNGIIVGVASITLLSRLGSALPSTGNGMELRAIAAVVIGGVPLSGGKGKALGTFLGIILTGLISNVLNLLNISAYYQEVAIGFIIALAVIISNIGTMKRK